MQLIVRKYEKTRLREKSGNANVKRILCPLPSVNCILYVVEKRRSQGDKKALKIVFLFLVSSYKSAS